ncbi:HD-GYP domain-containing protein [Chryseomicrobium palamuruense]|uniref:HD-GYP domain-containing protein n=1 Tax=Chryseomicrobium palamuruense TaxID=682973 RepID=A0ABV8UW74_9BACL
MKEHSTIGYDVFKHSNRDLLKAAAFIAHQQHERWNGRGYPQGLKGEEIHIFGRIIAIADVFDAPGSNRIYKKAWSDEEITDRQLPSMPMTYSITLAGQSISQPACSS